MSTDRTDAQREASRRNGAQSRGPITDAGKARSSLNGLKHGLRAATVVLTNESLELYNQLRESYIRKFRPADQPELDLVTQMVNAQWRLRRVWAQEAALHDLEMFIQHDDLHSFFAKVDAATTQALAFKAIALYDPTVMDRLDRAELRFARLYERAHRCLRAMRRNRTSEPENSDHATEAAESPLPSMTSESPDPETAEAHAHNVDVAEPTESLSDSNTATNISEEHSEPRYELQPDWASHIGKEDSRVPEIIRKDPNL